MNLDLGDWVREIEERGAQELYYDVELPLCSVLARMEHAGCRVDTAALAAFGARAVGTEGDIRSIEAVDVIYDESHGYYYPNNRTPHTVGESFYILVRLLDSEWKDPDVHEWQILQSADGNDK